MDCFYLLGGVSHAALDVFLQAFLWIYDSVSFQYIPRSEILSHRVILSFPRDGETDVPLIVKDGIELGTHDSLMM